MSKVKTAKVNVKVSEADRLQYVEVAGEYGLNLSEWAREAMRYVATNKPMLGKSYAPKGQSLQIAIN